MLDPGRLIAGADGGGRRGVPEACDDMAGTRRG